MKKCPKCKAEIEENARFCLYCMTSFEEKQTIEVSKEKNKWWLIIIAAVLVLALILTVIFFVPKNDLPKDTAGTSTGNSTHSDSDISEPSSTPENSSTNTSSGKKPSSNSSNNSSSNGSSKPGNGKPDNSKPDDDKPDNDNSSSGSSSDASSDNTSPTPKPEQTAVTYLYRDAVPADDYTGSPSVTNNAVVITGVKNASDSGKYDIPETINGKKVVAIMNNAFCDDNIKDTVKQVIIPSNVKTINAYAFYQCYNLTDIYIKGEAVACPSVILPQKSNRNFTITIHASATCHDRNFHTYKTLCTYLEVKFAEWNG